MPAPSPFTMSPFLMTSTISRQVLGPKVPASLRVVSRSKPAAGIITNATVAAAPPSAAVTQTRGMAFGSKASDMGEGKTHVTDKQPSDSKSNIHSSASKSGFADRATASGHGETHTGHARSQAATQKDENKAGEKAKEEHPEAPEPIIGMSDERGGRGR